MVDEQPDAHTAHPEFYENPHILALADEERWTVSSTRATEDRPSKFPLDVRCFVHGGLSSSGDPLPAGTIRGAFAHDETCLLTLDEMTRALPHTTNATFYLNTAMDGYVVVDIEKDCPPAEAARLLSMPEILYSEVSMSGKGFHLLMPVPENFWEYPDATGKLVLRHPMGWWEILLEHWITFTRQPIPEGRRLQMDTIAPDEPAKWTEVWAELAAGARAIASVEIDFDADKPDIPFEEEIVNAVVGHDHERSLKDYNDDRSSFEFAVLYTYYRRLDQMLSTGVFSDEIVEAFDDSVRAWVIYLAAQKGLKPRSKHEESRNGMPFLLNEAVSMVSKRRAEKEEKESR